MELVSSLVCHEKLNYILVCCHMKNVEKHYHRDETINKIPLDIYC